MAYLRSDSPAVAAIVLAIFDFLSSVKPAPNVDFEYVKKGMEYLQAVFQIDEDLAEDPQRPRDLLVSWFGSQNETKGKKEATDLQETNEGFNKGKATTHLAGVASSSSPPRVLSDELYEEYYRAFDKNGFFNSSSTEEIEARKAQAKAMFKEIISMSGCQMFNLDSVAEAFILKGNQAIHEGIYPKAIEFYSNAIFLNDNQPVYYSYRACALSYMMDHDKAISDCRKAILLDPTYVEAYSRLGYALFQKGNYIDAICHGFGRALQFDPNNSVAESYLQLAERKLKEEFQRMSEQVERVKDFETMIEQINIGENEETENMKRQLEIMKEEIQSIKRSA